jgi:hypothetical protein
MTSTSDSQFAGILIISIYHFDFVTKTEQRLPWAAVDEITSKIAAKYVKR